jgi:p-cumate 2,3-dioxygenase subunit beta
MKRDAAAPLEETTRAQVEDFLYREAALLDERRLDEWLALLTDDARYLVPSNDRPEADPANTLFTIADDIQRIRARVTRLKDKNAHAEHPPSRTRRMIANVRIVGRERDELRVEANFVVWRFRREERIREYVGRYRYALRVEAGALKIARREALIDAMELGSLGSVSFIL